MFVASLGFSLSYQHPFKVASVLKSLFDAAPSGKRKLTLERENSKVKECSFGQIAAAVRQRRSCHQLPAAAYRDLAFVRRSAAGLIAHAST